MSYNATTKWSIDTTTSNVSFVVNHLMISTVKGSFKNYNASIYTNGKDFSSAKIDFWLAPASIDTRDKIRDEHLISSEFFDVNNFPVITFVSDVFKKTETGDYDLYGNLTIKEITKRVKLTAKFDGFTKNTESCDEAKFTLTGSLNRKHWKLDWNVSVHAGSILVSDEVLIQCEIHLLKEDEAIAKDKSLLMEMEQGVAPEYAHNL